MACNCCNHHSHHGTCARCSGQRVASGCYHGTACASYDLNNSTTPCSICNACRRIAEETAAAENICFETVTAPCCGCRNNCGS